MWNGDNDSQSSPFWIGTSNGSPVNGSYENWGNEPDNWNNQDGLAIALTDWPLGQAGQWNDVFITDQLYFIIEYPPISLDVMENSMDTFTIWPNPAAGQINVSLPGKVNSIRITDSSGKLVFSSAGEGTTIIDVSTLSSGTYLVHAGTEVRRLIIE